MAGTPKNKLNKTRKGIERDNSEVAQDGVESPASLLLGGRLSGKVHEAVRAYYKRVKRIIYATMCPVYSASIGMKTVVPSHSNQEIYKQIETNKSNKFSSSGDSKSEEEETSKGQESREINTNSLNSIDKTKGGEYVLNWRPKKPGGGEMYTKNTATNIMRDSLRTGE